MRILFVIAVLATEKRDFYDQPTRRPLRTLREISVPCAWRPVGACEDLVPKQNFNTNIVYRLRGLTELALAETLPQIRWMEGGAPRRRNVSATPVCGIAFLTHSRTHALTLSRSHALTLGSTAPPPFYPVESIGARHPIF